MNVCRLSIIFMVLCISPRFLEARAVRKWENEELLAKSDLVVIAVPTGSHDTREHLNSYLGFDGQKVVGVETKFTVKAVLKGDQAINDLVLNHYRPDGAAFPNSPFLISFDPAGKQAFRLFLIRQADGHYALVSGQEDPGQSVQMAGKE